MTINSPGPNVSNGYADAPAPGGTRRFIITLAVVAAVLVGVVVGMALWMEATAAPVYRGPEELKKPDYPYYR